MLPHIVHPDVNISGRHRTSFYCAGRAIQAGRG